MELLLDKAAELILALIGFLGSIVIWLNKRSEKKHELADRKIDQVAKDLVNYKEQQYRDTENHRIRYDAEMSRLEARLEGVTVALEYMNKNINRYQESVDTNISNLQKTLNEIYKQLTDQNRN